MHFQALENNDVCTKMYIMTVCNFDFRNSHACPTRTTSAIFPMHNKIELFSYGKKNYFFCISHRPSSPPPPLLPSPFLSFFASTIHFIYCNGKFVRHEIKENIGEKYFWKKFLICSDVMYFIMDLPFSVHLFTSYLAPVISSWPDSQSQWTEFREFF